MLLLAAQLKVNAVRAGGVAAVVIAAVAVTAIIAVVPAAAVVAVPATVAVAAAGGCFDSRFVVAEPLLPFEVRTKLGLTAIPVQRRGEKEGEKKGRWRGRQERYRKRQTKGS